MESNSRNYPFRITKILITKKAFILHIRFESEDMHPFQIISIIQQIRIDYGMNVI